MKYLFSIVFLLAAFNGFSQFDFTDAVAKYESEDQLQKLYLDNGPLLIILDNIFIIPCECTSCADGGGSSNDGNLGGNANDGKLGGGSNDGKLGGASNQGKLGGGSNKSKSGGNSDKGKLGGNSGDGKLGGNSAEGKLGGGSNDGKLAGASKFLNCKRAGKKIKLANYSNRVDIYYYGARGKELVNKGTIKY